MKFIVKIKNYKESCEESEGNMLHKIDDRLKRK